MRQLTDAALSTALVAAIRRGDETAFHAVGAEMDRRDSEREARLSAPDALPGAAVWYAEHGIAVFPLQPHGKTPQRGSHGFQDATCDPATVRRWWQRSPQANIGLPTGCRFDVIDVDGPTGYRTLADLRDADAVPPVLARAATPSGGMHLYIAPTGDGNGAGLLPGIDYRGAGGYVVAPPSIGHNGHRYDWLDDGVDPGRFPAA